MIFACILWNLELESNFLMKSGLVMLSSKHITHFHRQKKRATETTYKNVFPSLSVKRLMLQNQDI